ncbi:hypothetical protein Dimus_017413 [Dionaea muscipula]
MKISKYSPILCVAIFLVLVLLLATPALARSDQIQDTSAAAAASNRTYLWECQQKLGVECGNAIFFHVFEGSSKDVVSGQCCQRLTLMGNPCHMAMVRSIMTLEQYNQNHVAGILNRSQEIWEHCSDESFRYIRQCEESLSQECGNAIFYYVFDGRNSKSSSGVKPECCDQLMNMGRRCHNDMTESILVNEDFQEHVDQIRARSKKLWQQCSSQ